MELESFPDLAARPRAPLDLLALALATQFRDVDTDEARSRLDALGAEVRAAVRRGSPADELEGCRRVLGERHGYRGARKDYGHPDQSMLDLVLARRRGLPILLSVVWVEVARRAGCTLSGIGLPGHYVVGHFGADPPLVVDPFARGARIEERLPSALVRPWGNQETILRLLNNLVGSYTLRGDLGRAIRAAEMRLLLPVDSGDRETLDTELGGLRARLN